VKNNKILNDNVSCSYETEHPHFNLQGQHPLVMTEGYKGIICTRIQHILVTKKFCSGDKIYIISHKCISLPAVVNINMSRNKIVFYNVSISLLNITKAVQSIQKVLSNVSQLLHQGGTTK
jgi:hypothetical protein